MLQYPGGDAAERGQPVKVLHACRGRVRARIAGLEGSQERAARLLTELGDVGGVLSVSPSIATGNIIVRFDPEVVGERTLIIVMNAVACGEAQPADLRRERPDWHGMERGSVASALNVTPERGLSSQAADRRLAERGRNVLSVRQTRSRGEILLSQVDSLPVALLGVAAVVSVATGGLIEAAAIAAVVGVNAVIGYVTETRAERTLSSLADIGAATARLMRDERVQHVAIDEVVVGDLMLLERGDSVPADARLIGTSGLTVSEAALTGEALPVEKTAAGLMEPDAPLAERHNMVYRGTIVTGGSATALVVSTGLETEVGRIHRLVAESRPPETPMQRNLGVLGRQLVVLTGVASVLLLVAGLLRGTPMFALVRSALSMAVAAVPEGLPMIATTLLAFGVERMRPRGMLVRRIEAIETLASVSVVCLDKTGTLTRNEMTVAAIVAGGRRHGAGDGRGRGSIDDPALSRLLEIACLCSDVELDEAAADRAILSGSATEAAFVRHEIGRASCRERV